MPNVDAIRSPAQRPSSLVFMCFAILKLLIYGLFNENEKRFYIVHSKSSTTPSYKKAKIALSLRNWLDEKRITFRQAYQVVVFNSLYFRFRAYISAKCVCASLSSKKYGTTKKYKILG